LAPVALRAPSAKANTEQQITCLQGGANSDHQKGPNQVDETIPKVGSDDAPEADMQAAELANPAPVAP